MTKEPSVSVVVTCLSELDWQVELTKAIIAIARATTKIPFELVISEAVRSELAGLADKYHWNKDKGFANADQNAGWALATGDVVVHLTNDVFVKPDWLEALLECFKIKDCGMAGLGTSDHKELASAHITEGFWCPLMAFPRRMDLRFDAEAFPSYWGDSDLVMRLYGAGFRAYRNHRVVCDHLGRASNTADHVSGRADVIEAAKQKFIARHGSSNLLIFRIFMSGWII